MNKKVCVSCILLGLCCSVFAREKLNVGNFRSGYLSVTCYDDCTIWLNDNETDASIILFFINIDSTIRGATALREFLKDMFLPSIYRMIMFFEENEIIYEYKQFSNSSDYYITSQAFVEEYLAPKYKISSGYKRIHNDYTSEYRNWNTNTGWYDYHLLTYSDYTVEYKNWIKDAEHYDYMAYIFTDHTFEYKDWNKNTEWYDYCLYTYSDRIEEGKNRNKETNKYDWTIKYSDHTEERKNWNKITEHYEFKKFTYSDYAVEFKNWNSEDSFYDYITYEYKDYTSEWQHIDGTYFNVDVKDKNGISLAYAHIISPLKNEMRDIEVLSENIIYRYIGVKKADDKFSFMSCIKIENGKETKLSGGTLSRDDFYRNDKYLLNKVDKS